MNDYVTAIGTAIVLLLLVVLALIPKRRSYDKTGIVIDIRQDSSGEFKAHITVSAKGKFTVEEAKREVLPDLHNILIKLNNENQKKEKDTQAAFDFEGHEC